MAVSRKIFLKYSLAISAGFLGLSKFLFLEDSSINAKAPFRKNKWLKLPEGFEVKLISKWGDRMSDGFYVPGLADGMGSFTIGNKTVFVRNHEIKPSDKKYSAFGKNFELLSKLKKDDFFDYGFGRHPGLGGTTNMVFNENTGVVEAEYLTLVGTNRNCAGGITPWKTWLSCEENVASRSDESEKNHGYNFEVPATAKSLVKPQPIRAMGRFNHEAVCIDPETGIVYQTEDRGDGLLYRYLPDEKENLHKGGTLQALKIKGEEGFDTRNWEQQTLEVGQPLDVEWITLQHVDPDEDDLRKRGRKKGAAVFARGEGMWYGQNETYFACTNGGKKLYGQVFKYIPSPQEGTALENDDPGKLVLFAESHDKNILKHCDNLTVAPWGDVLLCEDDNSSQIVGITPEGQKYKVGQNIYSKSELAGLCFSPSGKYLLVNIQEEGLTLAITGPWDQLKKQA